MADIQQKYQKLAQEYAKIRDQHRVLKAAILVEKEKENKFKETIKSKDLKVRKLEQEYESMNFRNLQLTRKVEGLQLELHSLEGRHGKHKGKVEDFHSPDPVSGVLQEELFNKIEENAKLHKQVQEETERHTQIITELQNKLVNFERENNEHHSVLEGLKKEHQDTVERLQEDKARLEIKVDTQDKVVQSSTLEASQCKDELHRVKEDLEQKLNSAMNTINNKLQFNDTENRELNSFNVPTHDRKHQKKTKELIGQSLTLVKELCGGLSNFHTYTEQRCKIFPIDASTGAPVSEVNQKFCAHLHENATFLRSVEQSFHNFYDSIQEDRLTTLETAVELGEFATKFSKYVTYHKTLLPYQLLSLEEECAISSCPQTLESRNMDVHASFKKMCSGLVTLESYITLLASISTASNNLPVSNHRAIFEKFAESAQHLNEVMRDISKSYNFKVSLEHQLPTATQKLKTTDECVVSSLISLVTCSGKLANFLKSNQQFFATPIEFRTRGHSIIGSADGKGSSPAVTQLRLRAAQYMTNLSRQCPESVPYETAIREHTVLISSMESKEGLTSQLQETKAKVNNLIEEKEHWLLEAQLIQMKLDQEKKRTEEMQEHLTQLMVGKTPETQVEPESNKPRSTSEEHQYHNRPEINKTMLGQFNTVSLDSDASDALQRETRIKDHYQGILRKETRNQQECEGQVVGFGAECRAMQKRLTLSERLKTELLAEQKEAQQNVSKLKEDLQVVKKSYESQLQVMSDHLCERNDKLTAQKDEIDALKLSLKQKQPSKKVKR